MLKLSTFISLGIILLPNCFANLTDAHLSQSKLCKGESVPTKAFGVSFPLKSSANYKTEKISLRKSGKYIFLPALAFSDLFNLNPKSSKLIEKPNGYYLTIHGADGEKGFQVTFKLSLDGVLQERIVETLFLKQLVTVKEQEKNTASASPIK